MFLEAIDVLEEIEKPFLGGDMADTQKGNGCIQQLIIWCPSESIYHYAHSVSQQIGQ